MSAINTSKKSSKSNLYDINSQGGMIAQNCNKQKKAVGGPYLSSQARRVTNQKRKMQFLKKDDKVKKSLAKQFQTFNQRNQDKEKSLINQDKDKNRKNENSQVQNGRKGPSTVTKKPNPRNEQMTTQAKTHKGEINLKSKHNQQNTNTNGCSSVGRFRKSGKKSLQSSKDLSKSPINALINSGQSSPQAKHNKYSIVQNNQKNQFRKAQSIRPSSKVKSSKSQIQASSTHKQRTQEQVQNEGFKKQEQQWQQQEQFRLNINFPQLITQSESMYPSSSYPNTGKQSIKIQDISDQQDDSCYQQQEVEQESEQQQYGEQRQNQGQEDDYISENQEGGEEEQQFQQSLQAKRQKSFLIQQNKTKNKSDINDKDAHNNTVKNKNSASVLQPQLPHSYLLAMQTMQSKLYQQQTVINRLKTLLNKQKQHKAKDDQLLRKSCQQLSQKQTQLQQKQNQINYLKGYLDQQKQNNRQALKQVARNVYQRSNLIKRKQMQQGQQKANKKQISNKKQQDIKSRKTNIISSQNNYTQDYLSHILLADLHSPLKNLIHRQAQSSLLKQKHQLDQLQLQLLRQKQLSKRVMRELAIQKEQEEIMRQQKIRQEFLRNQLIRESLEKQQQVKQRQMSFGISEEHRVKESSHRNLDYANDGEGKSSRRRNQRISSLNNAYPIQTEKKLNRNYNYLEKSGGKYGETGSFSDGHRLRSMSTALKPSQTNPNLTYRNQNVSNMKQPSKSILSYQLNSPSQYIYEPQVSYLPDPVLQSYMKSRTNLTNSLSSQKSYPYPQSSIKLKDELKSQAKNKQSVSQLRQLMRGQKQLVTLNYKLQALQNKILNCVESTNSQLKEKEQQKEKFMIQDLRRQYSLVKKQFQIKDQEVRMLKIKIGDSQRQNK